MEVPSTMSNSEPNQNESSHTPKNASDQDRIEQRVDQAHVVQPATAKDPLNVTAKVADDAALAPGTLSDQLSDSLSNHVAPSESAEPALPLGKGSPVVGQAGQLAEWLQQQQRDLAERTEAIETQEKDLAEKLASAYEWLEEQRHKLDEREEELDLLENPEEPSGPTPEQVEAIELRNRELDERQLHLDVETEKHIEERAKFAEHQQRLDDRQAKLVKAEKALQEKQSEQSDAIREANQAVSLQTLREEELNLVDERLKNQNAEIEERERRLDLRKQEIDSAIDRYERLDHAERRIAELQEQIADQAKRETYLEEAESLLAEERVDLAQQRERFEKESQALRKKLTNESDAFEQDRSAWQAEYKAMLEHAERRESEIDRRESALERLQVELQTTQREVLEMRLATEETWAQLTGLLAPAALTRSISKVRVQLADHYSHALQQINDSRGELREASAKIGAEFESLEQRRVSVEEWSLRRHEALGEAASRLEGREKELNRQQRQYEQYEARWASERESYREQIRTLLVELRDGEPAIRLARAA